MRPFLTAALTRRRELLDMKRTQAFRVFSGIADGVDGVYIDVYADGAVLIVYEGRPPRGFDANAEAANVLEVLRPLGVNAVYVKPFARDRSKLGGALPPCVTDPTPAAGEPLPAATLIREIDWMLEVRLFDGLSTGLFLDQRENRAWVARTVRTQRGTDGGPPTVLNTFAYTCAFSIAAARGGAATTSVDVSGRYLDWGKLNFTHNGMAADVESGVHRFAKFDTFEFLSYAKRKALKYNLIILDPPSFASAPKRKGARAWSSVADYPRLVGEAAAVLAPGGVIFASTNTQELCRPGRLQREVIAGLRKTPRWLTLPDAPVDFAREQDRFAALAFVP
jgi:23S rRNA (cytosine1962-C5)-methyltransferase